MDQSLTTHSGIFADNSYMLDMLVTNENEYKQFKDSIARSRMIVKSKKDVRTEINTSDYFLNLKEPVDLNKYNIIVIPGATIGSINVEKGVYQVQLGESLRNDEYCAQFVSKYDESKNLISKMNVKDLERVEIIEQRPMNANFYGEDIEPRGMIEQRPINNNFEECQQPRGNIELRPIDNNVLLEKKLKK